jgi:hypothetical protein
MVFPVKPKVGGIFNSVHRCSPFGPSQLETLHLYILVSKHDTSNEITLLAPYDVQITPGKLFVLDPVLMPHGSCTHSLSFAALYCMLEVFNLRLLTISFTNGDVK